MDNLWLCNSIHSFNQTNTAITIGSDQFFQAIEKALPPTFSRQTASQVLGNIIAPKTFANLDSLGQGPPRVRLGSKVGYERESFMMWLRQRLKP